jgi:starch synthase
LKETTPTPVRRRTDSAPSQLRTSEHPPAERPRLQLAEGPTTSTVELPPPPLTTGDGRPVSVVHLAPELAPFARTGGLGEAVASIAKYQAASGLPTALIMPLYAAVRDKGFDLVPVGDAFEVPVGPLVNAARVYQVAGSGDELRRPRVFFIENPEYFDRPGLYGEGGADYADNARRYAFFSLAALLALPRVASAPAILHAHDWQTALAPIYLRGRFTRHPYYRQVSTVLTVHNAGYQGHFPPETLHDIGLPLELFNWSGTVA